MSPPAADRTSLMKVSLPVRAGGSCRSTQAARGGPPAVRAGAHIFRAQCVQDPRRCGEEREDSGRGGRSRPYQETGNRSRRRWTAGRRRERQYTTCGGRTVGPPSPSVSPPNSCVVLDASPGTPERSGDVARRPLIPTRRSPRTHRARSSSGPPWDRPPPGSIGFPFGKAPNGVAVMARWPTGSDIAIVCDIDTRA